MYQKMIRKRVRSALWKILEERNANWSEIDRRLGKRRGWLYNQKTRRKTLDIADFWMLCRILEVDPLKLLRETLPEEPPRLDPTAEKILSRAKATWNKE